MLSRPAVAVGRAATGVVAVLGRAEEEAEKEVARVAMVVTVAAEARKEVMKVEQACHRHGSPRVE